MKLILLYTFLFFNYMPLNAQQGLINELPSGRYETSLKPGSSKWDRGDIILLDQSRYRISTSDSVGEYRFSKAAQRILFTSGPLRAAFAKVTRLGKKPAIELPRTENYHQQLASADVVAVLMQ